MMYARAPPPSPSVPAAAPVGAGQTDRFAALTGLYAEALDQLSDQGGPVALLPIALIEPPAWDSIDFAAVNLPETIRAAN